MHGRTSKVSTKETTLNPEKYQRSHLTTLIPKKEKEIFPRLYLLAKQPSSTISTFQGYEINGNTFYTFAQDKKSTNQNSGVRFDAEDGNGNKVTYYGYIEEIWELDYGLNFKVPLFQCKWFNLKDGVQVDPQYGMTTVDFKNLGYDTEPFVLASEVAQESPCVAASPPALNLSRARQRGEHPSPSPSSPSPPRVASHGAAAAWPRRSPRARISAPAAVLLGLLPAAASVLDEMPRRRLSSGRCGRVAGSRSGRPRPPSLVLVTRGHAAAAWGDSTRQLGSSLPAPPGGPRRVLAFRRAVPTVGVGGHRRSGRHAP
ncbi:hypothetical protein QYE76_048435 [Lolium multiflorum]|uniref:DUF4216 domain-containing protein n=1 Tax=Lolium multiflorum TaxID=4521 RepID=A0AAD8SN70_LOLMU|nr:hypothetical protein QYE76_048435 [Lolium multiflorum]